MLQRLHYPLKSSYRSPEVDITDDLYTGTGTGQFLLDDCADLYTGTDVGYKFVNIQEDDELLYQGTGIGQRYTKRKILTTGTIGEERVFIIFTMFGLMPIEVGKIPRSGDFFIPVGNQRIAVEVKNYNVTVSTKQLEKFGSDIKDRNPACAIYISLKSETSLVKEPGVSLYYMQIKDELYIICAFIINICDKRIGHTAEFMKEIARAMDLMLDASTERQSIMNAIDDVVWTTKGCMDITSIATQFKSTMVSISNARNVNVIRGVASSRKLPEINLSYSGDNGPLKIELRHPHKIIDGRGSDTKSSPAGNRDRAAVNPQVG